MRPAHFDLGPGVLESAQSPSTSCRTRPRCESRRFAGHDPDRWSCRTCGTRCALALSSCSRRERGARKPRRLCGALTLTSSLARRESIQNPAQLGRRTRCVEPLAATFPLNRPVATRDRASGTDTTTHETRMPPARIELAHAVRKPVARLSRASIGAWPLVPVRRPELRRVVNRRRVNRRPPLRREGWGVSRRRSRLVGAPLERTERRSSSADLFWSIVGSQLVSVSCIELRHSGQSPSVAGVGRGVVGWASISCAASPPVSGRGCCQF